MANSEVNTAQAGNSETTGGTANETVNNTRAADTNDGSNQDMNQDNRVTGRTGGSTGTGITADETGFGETGSLPDTAAPPVAR